MTTTVRIFGSLVDLRGKLAEGEFCNTYYGLRRDPAEALLVKMARPGALPEDEALRALQGEVRAIKALNGVTTVRGSDYFRKFLPRVVATAAAANVKGPNGFEGMANVFGYRSGFQYTYDDIGAAYPEGVDARTAIWMWKRTLDMLGWLHQAGYVHANVTPQHILVHPRDHGTVFCGWSRVNRIGTPLLVRNEADKPYYPKDVWEGGEVTPSMDITMTARCLFCVLGGDVRTGTLPDTVPTALADLIYLHAAEGRQASAFLSAWDLLIRVDEVAKIVYGGSKFHPFEMPRGSV